MEPQRVIAIVGNDKGGLGKSVTARELYAQFSADPAEPWQLVEIEARASFTQEAYKASANHFLPIGLIANNPSTGNSEPSLDGLDQLWSLIPSDAGASSRILIDCGASAFQSFMLWGIQRRGLHRFMSEKYRFLFFIVVQGSDDEAAKFFNLNAQTLSKLGGVVLVKNMHQGNDFSLLDISLVAQAHVLELPSKGDIVANQLLDRGSRLTFEQLANNPSASRRGRKWAGLCADVFAAQIPQLKEKFSL